MSNIGGVPFDLLQATPMGLVLIRPPTYEDTLERGAFAIPLGSEANKHIILIIGAIVQDAPQH